MTREENIKWLESLKAEIGKPEHRTLWHYAEAIDMAIEALSVANLKEEFESADAEPKRVLQGYCKGANCKWWNPQLNGCNRCVMIQDEYTHPSAEAVQLKQTDTLIIADALRYLAKDTERHLVDRTRADALRQQFLKYGASMCKGGAE